MLAKLDQGDNSPVIAVLKAYPPIRDTTAMRVTRRGVVVAIVTILALGFLFPEHKVIPVAEATAADWNKQSFWFEPWGKSGVHKGIDIFGKRGTAVLSTTSGLILFAGDIEQGGKVVLMLGPRWKLHYFAHLDSIEARGGRLVGAGKPIGVLGDSGNARGKPPHLHYSVVRIFPAFWAVDDSTQGYKKAFYIDPGRYLTGE